MSQPAPGGLGLTARRLEKQFYSRSGNVAALDAVSFHVAPAEFVCLVGPSGCGKSTLLRLLAGLLAPTGGELKFTGLPDDRRPQAAMIFQEHGLFPWMTVLDNVAFGLEAQGVPPAERRRRAAGLLAQIGLEGFARRYPRDLSVGMRQRAAIARALLVDPQVLLMDEPFSALDAQSKRVLQEELLRLWSQGRQTVFYVTHDIEEAVLLGDRVLVMSGRPGRIKDDLRIPLERPRDLDQRHHPVVQAVAGQIWKAIEGQVRQDLHVLA